MSFRMCFGKSITQIHIAVYAGIDCMPITVVFSQLIYGRYLRILLRIWVGKLKAILTDGDWPSRVSGIIILTTSLQIQINAQLA